MNGMKVLKSIDRCEWVRRECGDWEHGLPEQFEELSPWVRPSVGGQLVYLLLVVVSHEHSVEAATQTHLSRGVSRQSENSKEQRKLTTLPPAFSVCIVVWVVRESSSLPAPLHKVGFVPLGRTPSSPNTALTSWAEVHKLTEKARKGYKNTE